MSDYNASGMPRTGINAGRLKTLDKGQTKTFNSKYTFTGEEKAGDCINICYLPAGAKFIPFNSWFNGNEANATGTIEGYVSETSLAGHTNLAATTLQNDFDKVNENTLLQCRLSAAPEKGKEINFLLIYEQLV